MPDESKPGAATGRTSGAENEKSHDRQADIRRVAKILREGGYSYDQSAHLFKEARSEVGLTPPDRSSEGSPERLTSEELEAFLETAYKRSGRRGLMMRALFETGTRVGTFVKIDASGVAFRDREIRVVGRKRGPATSRFSGRWRTSSGFISATVGRDRSSGRVRVGATRSGAFSRS
jgi:integrase/recombinase XerD